MLSFCKTNYIAWLSMDSLPTTKPTVIVKQLASAQGNWFPSALAVLEEDLGTLLWSLDALKCLWN